MKLYMIDFRKGKGKGIGIVSDLEDIIVPRLNVNCKCSWPLSAPLIDISYMRETLWWQKYVRVSVCMCMYVCVCAFYASVCVHTCVCTYINLSAFAYTDVFTCTCAYLDYIYIVWYQIIGTFQEDEDEEEKEKDGLPCSSIEDSQHRNQTVRSSFRALK